MTQEDPLGRYVAPMLGLPAWGVKQGYGSFLTFKFGEPRLIVHEWQSREEGPRRSAYVSGRWHLWIYVVSVPHPKRAMRLPRRAGLNGA